MKNFCFIFFPIGLNFNMFNIVIFPIIFFFFNTSTLTQNYNIELKHLRVRFGDGEVENDLDFGVVEQFLNTARADTVLRGFCFGAFWINVRARRDFNNVVRFAAIEVCVANVAASDHSDFDWLIHWSPCLVLP